MDVTRRDFIKTAGSAVILGLAATMLPQNNTRALAVDSGMAIKINVVKCIACGKCHTACGTQNNLKGATFNPNKPFPLSGQDWVAYVPAEKGKAWHFRKHSCMHCTDASCMEVCPTGAISRQGEAVIIDQDWCTGCGYCAQACPFGVPHKDEETGTARKCNFCITRVSQGGTPACVEVCPTSALTFGPRDEMIESARTQVAALIDDDFPDANVYGVTELGGMHVIYVLDAKPTVYGLPDLPQTAISTSPLKWTSSLAAFGIALAPLWLVLKRRGEKEATPPEVKP